MDGKNISQSTKSRSAELIVTAIMNFVRITFSLLKFLKVMISKGGSEVEKKERVIRSERDSGKLLSKERKSRKPSHISSSVPTMQWLEKKNELVHMFNHPSGSAAIEFCRKRQELENGTHKHLFFSSMKVFINNTLLPPLLIVK